MGFMTVSVSGSDTANGFAMCVGDQIATLMRKELKQVNSMWNTDGYCNVALLFDEFIIPSGLFVRHEALQKVAYLTLKKIDTLWFNNRDRNPKLDKDYRKLRRSLHKYVRDL